MDTTITGGSRGRGKTLEANKEIVKQWPKGKIAFASRKDIRYSEEADAEEI